MPIRLQEFISPRMLALCASLCLSLWVWIGGQSINTDGAVYLNIAYIFSSSSEGFHAAQQMLTWPFYSVFIATIAKLGLSLETAAYLLNLIFFATSSVAFVLIGELLFPLNKRAHYLATAVILLLPRINYLREGFFRDNGYLAFVLLSLLAMLHFARNAKMSTLFIWAAMVINASFFRPEAALLLAVCPIVLFSTTRKITLRSIGMPLLLFSAMILGLIVSTHIWLTDHHSPLYWWHYYTTDFSRDFENSANAVANSVLSEFSNDYGREGVIAVLMTVLLGAILSVLTPVYALVIWLTRNMKAGLSIADRRVMIAYGLCFIIPPILFVLKFRFVSSRYVLGFVIILLMTMPIKLLQLTDRIRSGALRYAVIGAIALFFTITSMRELTIDTAQRDAGLWLSRVQGSVWTNNFPLWFYVQNADRSRKVEIENNAWPHSTAQNSTYNWIALVARKSQTEDVAAFIKSIQGSEEKRFYGSGRVIVIIKTNLPNHSEQKSS